MVIFSVYLRGDYNGVAHVFRVTIIAPQKIGKQFQVTVPIFDYAIENGSQCGLCFSDFGVKINH